jgi:hypothetical protein
LMSDATGPLIAEVAMGSESPPPAVDLGRPGLLRKV